jgi:HPt (histidine-containing phosphotransfer) domain-containing protein/PAS domain-containing protein
LKILALSQDISLLNIVDYILYKDYKIVKSTSFENLDVELSSFDLVIIDLPYWEKNPNIHKILLSNNNIPLIILTEDKSSSLLSTLKNDFYVRSVLKEPLSKKELKETVKELSKKKKNKKEKDRTEERNDFYVPSPIETLVNNSEIVFFRITDLQDKRIEFISENYKSALGLNYNLGNLKILAEENEIPFISHSSPGYSMVYRIKDSTSFKIVKETGKGIFDSNKYLVNIEGTITDYTETYLEQCLLKFFKSILDSENSSLEITEYLRKIIHVFSRLIPKDLTQLSIVFSNKDYFTNDFITTDFLITGDIVSDEKKLGEVLLFSLNNNFEEVLKEFSKILTDIIFAHYQKDRSINIYKEDSVKFKTELSLISTRLAQAEAAFQDKASSYDNLNELFSSAMKDFKTISSKLNRTAIILETNAEGKFLSANENYYRAVGTDKANLIGKYFDDIFDNSNWQNFQFEFFNNANQEMFLKQKNREGKSFYFSFNVAREESDKGYKFVFYGKDKTEAKSLEIELSKQITEYNNKITELIDAKKANELLWEEINTLKEEIKSKDEILKKQEKKILKLDEKLHEEKVIQEVKPVTVIQENKEYSLEKPEAEIIFKEDVQQKIEEAQEEIKNEQIKNETQDENEAIFKNLKGIDFKIGLSNAYDNVETYNEVLVNFENDYVNYTKEIRQANLINDKEYIKSRLLTLAEESKYIGAEDLEKSAQLFHDKINENKVNNFDFELSVLNVHLNFTLDSIRKYKTEYALLEPSQKIESAEETLKIIAEEEFREIAKDVRNEMPETELTIMLAPEKTEELRLNDTELISEEITEENKTVEEIQNEIHSHDKIQIAEDPFTILVNDLKKSLEVSEDSSILKEKLFKLKFENNDFGKIEKIEAIESGIESGNYQNAISILDDLKS